MIKHARAKDRRADLARAQGYIATTGDRNNGATGLTVHQVVYGVPLYLHRGDLITNITAMCGGAGASLTWVEFGLYAVDGTLLGTTGDVAASVTAAGELNFPLTTPYRVTADGEYFVAALCTHGGTAITLVRAASSMAGPQQGGTVGEGHGAFQTAQSALPSPATWSVTYTGTNVPCFWFGLS